MSPDPGRRVRNRDSGEGYLITPGGGDGQADDAFGVGDFWALRFRGGQIDVGQGFPTQLAEARVHIDRFANGESLVATNLVVWYAAHFTHDTCGVSEPLIERATFSTQRVGVVADPWLVGM